MQSWAIAAPHNFTKNRECEIISILTLRIGYGGLLKILYILYYIYNKGRIFQPISFIFGM